LSINEHTFRECSSPFFTNTVVSSTVVCSVHRTSGWLFERSREGKRKHNNQTLKQNYSSCTLSDYYSSCTLSNYELFSVVFSLGTVRTCTRESGREHNTSIKHINSEGLNTISLAKREHKNLRRKIETNGACRGGDSQRETESPRSLVRSVRRSLEGATKGFLSPVLMVVLGDFVFSARLTSGLLCSRSLFPLARSKEENTEHARQKTSFGR